MARKILGGAQLAIGIFFLCSVASDIQAGFGLVLVGQGIGNLIK